MLKGWIDHTLYGIIVFFGAGFATAWFIQEKIIIQNQVTILEKQLYDLKTEKEKQETECRQKISTTGLEVSKINISTVPDNTPKQIEPISSSDAHGNQAQAAPIVTGTFPSATGHIQTVGNLSLTMDRCIYENGYITCPVTVINQGEKDVKIKFENSAGRGGQLILADGNAYKLASFKIGTDGPYSANTVFIPGVPVLAHFFFRARDIPTAKTIKLLELQSGLPSRFMDIQIN